MVSKPTVIMDRRGVPGAALVDELAALQAERDPLLRTQIRTELWAEHATAQLAQVRAVYDAACQSVREAASRATAARRALERHDAAIAEVQAEIAATGGGT